MFSGKSAPRFSFAGDGSAATGLRSKQTLNRSLDARAKQPFSFGFFGLGEGARIWFRPASVQPLDGFSYKLNVRINVYWISNLNSGRLGVMPRPRGGDWLEDEISALKQLEVDAVASLLEAHEVDDLDIADEARLCRERNIEFLSFPIVDRNIPVSLPEFSSFVEKVASLLCENKNVVVHCWQGVGRAGLLAACALIRNGISADEALSLISEARGCVVPETEEQKAFVLNFGKVAL